MIPSFGFMVLLNWLFRDKLSFVLGKTLLEDLDSWHIGESDFSIVFSIQDFSILTDSDFSDHELILN